MYLNTKKKLKYRSKEHKTHSLLRLTSFFKSVVRSKYREKVMRDYRHVEIRGPEMVAHAWQEIKTRLLGCRS